MAAFCTPANLCLRDKHTEEQVGTGDPAGRFGNVRLIWGVISHKVAAAIAAVGVRNIRLKSTKERHTERARVRIEFFGAGAGD